MPKRNNRLAVRHHHLDCKSLHAGDQSACNCAELTFDPGDAYYRPGTPLLTPKSTE